MLEKVTGEPQELTPQTQMSNKVRDASAADIQCYFGSHISCSPDVYLQQIILVVLLQEVCNSVYEVATAS